MDEPYLGEIHIIASDYAPRGYAFCNGQLLPINSNQALYSLLGTQFGGNGVTTFALPDLRSRLPIGIGTSPGGSNYVQGQIGGLESVTLNATQIPAHIHTVTGTLQSSDSPDGDDPTNNLPASGGRSQFTSGAANAPMGAIAGTSGSTGSSQGHENRQPYIGLNYVIALVGLYPSRA